MMFLRKFIIACEAFWMPYGMHTSGRNEKDVWEIGSGIRIATSFGDKRTSSWGDVFLWKHMMKGIGREILKYLLHGLLWYHMKSISMTLKGKWYQ
jgi:hypothetical protein